jgi:polyisoprenyl-teichoic acid--peptidoglycan teichoic acid transferase
MRMNRLVAPLLLLSIPLIGCIVPAAVQPALTGLDASASPTRTPFAPAAPTDSLPSTATPAAPTASPTPSNPWGNFAGPIEQSAIEIPPPVPEAQQPQTTVNLILLGTDTRPTETVGRTDTMMIVILDPVGGTATLISIPRDLYVYLPGFRVDRINTAEARGGTEMLTQTILYNFGIPLDHWARTNFTSFMTAVDLLGGLDVQAGGYTSDECGGNYLTFGPGVHHMNGFTALCYVRMRKASSDYDRLRRQQEVLNAMFSRILSLDGLARVPDLYAQFGSLVQTDMQLGDLLPLVPLAARLATDPSRIHRFSVDTSMATGWRVPYSGASVQLPNREAIQAMLQQALNP